MDGLLLTWLLSFLFLLSPYLFPPLPPLFLSTPPSRLHLQGPTLLSLLLPPIPSQPSPGGGAGGGLAVFNTCSPTSDLRWLISVPVPPSAAGRSHSGSGEA